MNYQKLFIFALFLICIVSLSDAYNFKVGGKDGWTLNPSENYNQWSGRMRFLINDTLSFKYPKGSDSVLVVSKDDYEKCNTSKPLMKFEDGDSLFKFDRSGPFYFISGDKSKCNKGQKMIIVVLAIRNKKSPPAAPTPSSSAPASSPATPSPASSAPVPSPATPSPASSAPAPSPTTPSPAISAPAPNPTAQAPVPAPASQAPGPSPTSAEVPASSPVPSTSTPTAAPGSEAPGSAAPGSAAPGTPASKSPSSSPGNTPADISSPPGSNKSSAPAVSPAVAMGSVVLSVVLGSFIISI